MSVAAIAIYGAIIQLAFWLPIWLTVIADLIWAAFTFKVAALINLYVALVPTLVSWALILWKARKKVA